MAGCIAHSFPHSHSHGDRSAVFRPTRHVQNGRKYRLYPDADQAPILAQWIGCARALYNAKNEEEYYLQWLRRYSKFSARSFAPDEGESNFTFDQQDGIVFALVPPPRAADMHRIVPVFGPSLAALVHRVAVNLRRHFVEPRSHVLRRLQMRVGPDDSDR